MSQKPEPKKIIHPVVYVTKYALTTGIEVYRDVEQCVDRVYDRGDGTPTDTVLDMIRVRSEWGNYFHKQGRDWHLTEEAARLRVVAMKAAKRKSLQKALARLEAPVKLLER